jgi:hypothetical protein
MVMAALRLDSDDAAIYASVLTKSLSEALPPGYVTVERERSMSDRMHGRPGEISKVEVKLGDHVMTLAVKNGRTSAQICRAVRGVVLSTQPVSVQQWAAALASALMSHAESNAQAAEALRRLVIGS